MTIQFGATACLPANSKVEFAALMSLANIATTTLTRENEL
jgi:hypothetical protein